jgi:hypothetical protein
VTALGVGPMPSLCLCMEPQAATTTSTSAVATGDRHHLDSERWRWWSIEAATVPA